MAAVDAVPSAQPTGSGPLPVIDVGPLTRGDADAADKARSAAALRQACVEWGFFYITNHGLEKQVPEMVAATRALFDLPEAEKAALAASLSPLHRGWTGLGGAHNCSSEAGPDTKESFLLGAEGSASPMHGANPWPPAPLLPGWQGRVRAYFAAALDLSRAVSRGLALALGLPESFFADRMRDPVAQLLLLRYPAPPGGARRGRGRGCGEHTDCGFLTILAQDDVPGLEVRRRRGTTGGGAAPAAPAACCGGGGEDSDGDLGEWVAAPPLPGALLVNLGDLAAFWSGGVVRSTLHRVFIDDAAGRARHSCVFFCNCDFDAEVRPGFGAEAAAKGASGGGGGVSAGGSGPAAPMTAGKYILEKLGIMYS
ncbi:hypothetical protein Rsub_09585 [Raphidocelis subcapitata]|uniref:Fe2OG dioxygenase domain-containing protein n=1 Tax=Raphidocelis subcapitata TaxID=307507 RepID=A0A2V0PD22_9CHLO|nr:hypothetical protein Rsub_09585 [Raphidocelis subcapitata]|eukprot:GBF97419.1 hypothetical protein Rsub_09585 [Raphidocelis subcapitata]